MAQIYVERDEISICNQMIENDTVYYYDWHDTKNRQKYPGEKITGQKGKRASTKNKT